MAALKMEELTLWTMERVGKMPRTYKFELGDRLMDACLEVSTLLVEASFVRDKAGLLAQASRGLTRARILVRLAERLRLLSQAQQEHFDQASVEVGRMIGGWARSVRSRDEPEVPA